MFILSILSAAFFPASPGSKGPQQQPSSKSLHDAAASNDLVALQSLLKADSVSVDERGMIFGEIAGATALHVAAWHGHTEAARLLLTSGACVDEPALACGGTPLHLAAAANAAETAELLLSAGAPLQRVDHEGQPQDGVR